LDVAVLLNGKRNHDLAPKLGSHRDRMVSAAADYSRFALSADHGFHQGCRASPVCE
jgi:hypothetical protein